ncbi:hypothetical protein TURU_053378 [Turdus rufiventris]|nr:hypothetical protein TURU_053378 [Turdus rufiventris]
MTPSWISLAWGGKQMMNLNWNNEKFRDKLGQKVLQDVTTMTNTFDCINDILRAMVHHLNRKTFTFTLLESSKVRGREREEPEIPPKNNSLLAATLQVPLTGVLVLQELQNGTGLVLTDGTASRDSSSGGNISNDATFLDSELIAGKGGNIERLFATDGRNTDGVFMDYSSLDSLNLSARHNLLSNKLELSTPRNTRYFGFISRDPPCPTQLAGDEAKPSQCLGK